MKRSTALLLTAVLIMSLTACGSQSSASTEASSQVTPSLATGTTVIPESALTDAERAVSSDESKILILYFSPSNADTVDAVSSATPRVGELSSVEYVAQIIGSQVGAGTAKIVPENPYPLVYERATGRAKAEQDDGARPGFALDIDPEEYDVIFVGYPVWWYHLPMIVKSFFDAYDFGGKTIIPFNTHAGSRDGGTYREIAGLEPNATVLEGVAVEGERAGSVEKDVLSWLARLGY